MFRYQRDEFNELKQKVTVWRKLIADLIPKSKQGLLLVGEMPVKGKYGGLQGIVKKEKY